MTVIIVQSLYDTKRVYWSNVESVPIRRFLAILCLSILMVIHGASQAQGQLSSFDVRNTLPPNGVARYGTLEVTWVKSQLGNGKLFQIASPTVVNRSAPLPDRVPVEIRAKNIEDLIQLEIGRYRQRAIAQILGSGKDSPRSVQVIISKLKSLPVLQVSDSESSRPLTIATVTSLDANFYSETPDAIAQNWKTSLEREIETAEQLYSPDSFPRRVKLTALIPVGLILWTGLFVLGRFLIGRKLKILRNQYKQEVRSSSNNPQNLESGAVTTDIGQKKAEAVPLELKTILSQQFSLANQIDTYRSAQLILLWIVILSWYFGIYLISTRLPILLPYSEKVLTRPLALLVIWFLVSLILRISHFLIQRSVNAWKENSHLIFGDAKRQVLRSQTIAGALKGLTTFILIFIGIILTLAQFGLPASSILTGSALLGLAISFGAQSLVKDVVNGCLILLEDQFAVGDIITINQEIGIVEQLNLRLTQLRSFDGELISIPNSSITLVKNKTSSWSRVNLGLKVAYNTNLDQAIAVMTKTALQMSQDAEWEELILEPPQVLGVDDFGENGITIRLWIQTEPGQQAPIEREFRRRIKLAFDQAGISIPFPQRSIWIENLDNAESNTP